MSATLVTFHTSHGDIVVELFDDSGTHSLERWLRLVRGPVFHPDVGTAESTGIGYYTGLPITYTYPHIEITTAARPPEESVQLPVEINAESLGLHEQRVETLGAATDLVQMVLYPAYSKTGPRSTPQLLEWLEQYHQSESAQFLVGTSQKEINEALGHVYSDDVTSHPFVKGCVALKPISPTAASPRLTFALADLPERTGRWMVIGRVVKGLDLVDRIALMPLKGKGTVVSKSMEPMRPVVITSVSVTVPPGAVAVADGED